MSTESVEILESVVLQLPKVPHSAKIADMTTIEKILRLIEARGLKQSHVERAAGLAVNRISKWRESGEPTASQLWALSKALDVPVGYLADPTQTEPPSPPAAGEAAVLEVYRALHAQGVTAQEAIVRLMRPAPRELPAREGEPLGAWSNPPAPKPKPTSRK